MSRESLHQIPDLIDIYGKEIHLPLLTPIIEHHNCLHSLEHAADLHKWLTGQVPQEVLRQRLTNKDYMNSLSDMYSEDYNIHEGDGPIIIFEKKLVEYYLLSFNHQIQEEIISISRKKVFN